MYIVDFITWDDCFQNDNFSNIILNSTLYEEKDLFNRQPGRYIIHYVLSIYFVDQTLIYYILWGWSIILVYNLISM